MAGHASAREVAESITEDLLGAIRAKLDKFNSGDVSSSLTTEEVEFVQKCQSISSRSDLEETEAQYLRGLNNAELSEYHSRLRESLN